jgi:hypothetical protein
MRRDWHWRRTRGRVATHNIWWRRREPIESLTARIAGLVRLVIGAVHQPFHTLVSCGGSNDACTSALPSRAKNLEFYRKFVLDGSDLASRDVVAPTGIRVALRVDRLRFI